MSGPDPGNDGFDAAPQAQPADASAPTPDHGERIAELFESHNTALLRFLTCRLHSSQEAKEVAQEAYVRLLQLDAPGRIGYLRAFLFKTASNLAADRLKSTARRERIDRLDFFKETERFEPSPEHDVLARQELTQILEIVNELPARCRYAFVMHLFYGHSIVEVADRMSLSKRMVQIYVERALVFCRDRLGESSGGRDE